MRRMVIGGNTRGYNAAFLAVLKAAQRAATTPEGDIAEAVLQALDEAPNSLVWPSDEAIAAAFVGSTFYGSFTQERIRLLLGAIDQQLRQDNKKTEPATFDYDKLQIEHVMPRAWREHWPPPESCERRPGSQGSRASREGRSCTPSWQLYSGDTDLQPVRLALLLVRQAAGIRPAVRAPVERPHRRV